MSEVIVRMEMPTGCRWNEGGKTKRCPIAEWGGACAVTKLFESFNDNRPSWCPIIGELPEQHGRIIDEAAFCENVVKYSHQSTKTIGKALDATPTIIDMTPIVVAERKDNEQTRSNTPS